VSKDRDVCEACINKQLKKKVENGKNKVEKKG